MKKWKQGLACLLSMVLASTVPSVPAFAKPLAAGEEQGGLCEHHTEHTEACGYAASSGGLCAHEHTEDCYRLIEVCVHQHSTACYPEPDAGEATPSQANKPTECSHECTEESGCVQKVLACPHEHGESCGYEASVEGTPCGYVCPICSFQADDTEDPQEPDSIDDSQEPNGTENAQDSEELEALQEPEWEEPMPMALRTWDMDADGFDWEQIEVGDLITVDSVEYLYQGDYSKKQLFLESFENGIFQAGEGYILWEKTEKQAILCNASVTVSVGTALGVPNDTQIIIEGANTLKGVTNVLNSEGGDFSVTGSGSLTIQSSNDFWFDYGIHSGSGVKVDIEGDFICGGVCSDNGALELSSDGEIIIEGIVLAKCGTISICAGEDLSITNNKQMAVWSQSSANAITLTAGGDLTICGGRDYSSQQYAVCAENAEVTIDASGEVLVSGYDGYPGVYADQLFLSGEIPAETVLHTSCGITVPAGKILTNAGTLSLNDGGVTVAGALLCTDGSLIQTGTGAVITPTVEGNGSVQTAPVRVAQLDFRRNPPAQTTEYQIKGGGTAKWEPKAETGAEKNKLTLNGVCLSGDSDLVAVPDETELVLTGSNQITAKLGNANNAMMSTGTLVISGDGSLTVTAPADSRALYGENGIEIDLSGALMISGQLRANHNHVSVNSQDAIEITGSVYGENSVEIEAGKALTINNASGAGVYAGQCTLVRLAAAGDLTVQGSGNYAIYGSPIQTDLVLEAGGILSFSGSSTITNHTIYGKTTSLAGTLPKGSLLFTNTDVTVPQGKKLIHHGTLQLLEELTVEGTLENDGLILNSRGEAVVPTGSGNTSGSGAYLDFTDHLTPASGSGYIWDANNQVLTLDSFVMENPVERNSLILPDGAKLIVKGTNLLRSKGGLLLWAKGSLEITGTGTLVGTTDGAAAIEAEGDLVIRDSKLELTTTAVNATGISIQDHDFTIEGTADVTLIAAASGSNVGIKMVDGDFMLEKEAELTIQNDHVGILSKVEKEEKTDVKIYGSLNTADCTMCANLLSVRLDLQGSAILMSDAEEDHIWLYQKEHWLSGETDLEAFHGVLKVATGNDTAVSYYKVETDASVGLYAVGSMVSVKAEPITGKRFLGWTAEGVKLADPSAMELSFLMPEQEVRLYANYHTPVSGVTLSASALSMKTGETTALKAVITPEDASNQQVSWSSSDPEVAAVEEHGVVTAKKSGSAVITATSVDGGKTACCNVTVLEKQPELPDNSGGDHPDSGDSGNDSGSHGSGGGSGNSGSSGHVSSRGERTLTRDSRKGLIHSVNGIVTGATGSMERDGYSHWIKEEKGWKLRYADGTYASGVMLEEKEKNTWEKINGAWYLFGVDGYLKCGWYRDADLQIWYYLDENTGMKIGWYFDVADNCWYYFDASGAMLTGWHELDGSWIFFPEKVG